MQGWYELATQSTHGTFREYFVLPAKFAPKVHNAYDVIPSRLATDDLFCARCLKFPPSLSFDEAATVPSGVATAVFPLYNPNAPASVKLTPPWTEEGAGKYAGKACLVLGGAGSMGQYGP